MTELFLKQISLHKTKNFVLKRAMKKILLIALFFFIGLPHQFSYSNNHFSDLKKIESLSKSGEINKAIELLENLVRKYPQNIDLKIKLLQFYIQTNESGKKRLKLLASISKLQNKGKATDYKVKKIISQVKKSYLDKQLATKNISSQSEWTKYIDVTVKSTNNSNVNDVSNSNTFFSSGSVTNYASGTVKSDNTYSLITSYGAYKTLKDGSELDLSLSYYGTDQDSDDNLAGNTKSFDVGHIKQLNNHELSSYYSFSIQDYNTDADYFSHDFSIEDKINIFDKNYFILGLSLGKLAYDNTEVFSTSNNGNYDKAGFNIGYEIEFTDKDTINLNYIFNKYDAKINYNSYDNNDWSINYTKQFDKLTLLYSLSYTENQYDASNSSVLSTKVREDEILNNYLALYGRSEDFKFLSKYSYLKDTFFKITYSDVKSNSNILNYDYDKETISLSLTKRKYLN